MSLQPVFGEPNGYPMSDDQIVDQLIGNAYKTVRFVAERMPLVRAVATDIDKVNVFSDNIQNLNAISSNIPNIISAATATTENVIIASTKADEASTSAANAAASVIAANNALSNKIDNTIFQAFVDDSNARVSGINNFLHNIPGAAVRTLHSKVRDKVSFQDFGVESFGSTTAVSTAIANVPSGRNLSTSGEYIYVNSYVNYLGKPVVDGGGIAVPSPVGGWTRSSYYPEDRGRKSIGKEYLYRLFQRIKNGGTMRGYLYGDSTTATAAMGGGYAGAAFEPQVLLRNYMRKVKGVRNPISITNRAIGGKTVLDMNPFADLAQDGTVDFMGWKLLINEYFIGEAAYVADLRNKLEALRANPYGRPDMLTIFLFGGMTHDPASGRTPEWYRRGMEVLFQLGREYKCFVFDSCAYIADVSWAAGTALDQPYNNEMAVHARDIVQSQTWGGIVDEMLGADITPWTTMSMAPWSTSVVNSNGIITEAVVDAQYKLSGGQCHVNISISLPAVITGTGPLMINLPEIPTGNLVLVGRELATQGVAVTATSQGTLQAAIVRFDNQNVGTAGSVIVLSGAYNYV